MLYTRVDSGDDCTAWNEQRREGCVVFTAESSDGGVRTMERFVVVGDGMGSCVTYSLALGTRGWRRLPCFGAFIWAQLAADGKQAQRGLAEALKREAYGPESV